MKKTVLIVLLTLFIFSLGCTTTGKAFFDQEETLYEPQDIVQKERGFLESQDTTLEDSKEVKGKDTIVVQQKANSFAQADHNKPFIIHTTNQKNILLTCDDICTRRQSGSICQFGLFFSSNIPSNSLIDCFTSVRLSNTDTLTCACQPVK